MYTLYGCARVLGEKMSIMVVGTGLNTDATHAAAPVTNPLPQQATSSCRHSLALTHVQ